jgi:hypothetical protein
MSHERKAFFVWLTAMTLFVVTVLAVTTLYPMAGVRPWAAGVPDAPAPPLPPAIEVNAWHIGALQ